MPSKIRMRDVVILLPGITGSVLQKDDKDLWAISGQAFWQVFKSLGGAFESLKLTNDDPEKDDLGDGIRATRLMPDAHFVPGVWKIDGYSRIVQMLKERFDFIHGNLNDNRPANFFEFPYDWRRDNRASARALKKLIDQKLPQWRNDSGAKDAKVILVAHSMGGLVSRCYLELLEGWRDCKALITFGTPYRGSVDMLNYLSNGYKKLFLDLTEMMRTFTSAYQLLPRYELINVGGKYRRVAEIDSIPGIVKTRAEQALSFHHEIDSAVEAHRKDSSYLNKGYKIIPVVGTHQQTFQSAELLDGRLHVSSQLPAWIDPALNDGDGRVPYVSAIPIELSNEYRETFVAECHGSLQNNDRVLDDLYNRLKRMQTDLESIQDPGLYKEGAERAAIRLTLDDLYIDSEPVKIGAEVLNLKEYSGGLRARLESITSNKTPITAEFQEGENGWVLMFDHLDHGLYRLEVQSKFAGQQAPTPVHNLFEVIPNS